MAKIEWTEEFSVQNKEIDEQHKKWIAIYNKAHDRMLRINTPDDTINIGRDALKEMIEYSKYHFSSEEKFMESIKYPKREEHKKIHRDFSKKLDLLAMEMKSDIFVLNSEIIKVLENWLMDHILFEDKKFVK